MSLHRVRAAGFLIDIRRGDLRPWLPTLVAWWWFTSSRPDRNPLLSGRVLALPGAAHDQAGPSHSTGRCNGFREYICRRPIAECLAGSCVELARNPIQLRLGVAGEVGPFRQILA